MAKIQRFLPLVVGIVLLNTFMMKADNAGGVGPGEYEWLTVFATMFVAILLEAIPFVLLGAVISGAIEVLIPSETLISWIPRNPVLAVLVSGLAGFVLPICECGVVPVLRRLLRKGVPVSCGITYLLAAPIMQPLVAISTYLAFGRDWRIVALRLGGGYLVAVTVGLLSLIVFSGSRTETIFASSDESDGCGCGHSHHSHSHSHSHHEASHTHEHAGPVLAGTATGRAYERVLTGSPDTEGPQRRIERSDVLTAVPHDPEPAPIAVSEERPQPKGVVLMEILEHASEDFLSTSSYLVLGAFLAAAMQTFVGQALFSRLAHGAILSTLVMMLLAFTLSLCSQADAFVAASFMQFPLAARIAFMVFGPTVDIKLIAMYQGFLSRKATVFIFGSVTVLVFLYAMILSGLRL